MIILFEIATVTFVFSLIGLLIVGLVAGFFLSRWFFKRELAKNPPINEKMIRAMFKQMGRTPSEKQVREIMRSVNSQK